MSNSSKKKWFYIIVSVDLVLASLYIVVFKILLEYIQPIAQVWPYQIGRAHV